MLPSTRSKAQPRRSACSRATASEAASSATPMETNARAPVVGPPAAEDLHEVVGVVLAVLLDVLGAGRLDLGVRVAARWRSCRSRVPVAVAALQLVGHVPVGGRAVWSPSV